MRRTSWLILAGACLALASCSSSNPLEMLAPSVTGTWDTTVTVTGGTAAPAGTIFDVVLDLVQTGSNVTGTYTTSTGDGTVTGTVSGRTLTFTLTQVHPCAGSFSGSATIGPLNAEMTGSFSGSDCAGTMDASFLATKR